MICHPREYNGFYLLNNIENSEGRRMQDPFAFSRQEEDRDVIGRSVGFQDYFPSLRMLTLHAARSIVSETFDFTTIERGAEFGAGCYGWLFNHLLSPGVNWTQFEINSEAARRNRAYTKRLGTERPRIVIASLYDMSLRDNSVDVIAGHSSWDSIMFFEDSLREVDRCLHKGGFFVHYQDVHPADMPLVLTEALERKKSGLEWEEIPVVFYDQVSACEVPGFFRREKHIVGIDSTRFGVVSLGLYLTKHLAKLFERRGYKIIQADEVVKEVTVPRQLFAKTIRECGYADDFRWNAFATRHGMPYFSTDRKLADGHVKESALMQVLVAQKPK